MLEFSNRATYHGKGLLGNVLGQIPVEYHRVSQPGHGLVVAFVEKPQTLYTTPLGGSNEFLLGFLFQINLLLGWNPRLPVIIQTEQAGNKPMVPGSVLIRDEVPGIHVR